MSTAAHTPVRPLPDLAEPASPRRPRIHRRTLSNGLRVAAIRKNDTPIVELRLRIPLPVTPALLARVELLSSSFMAGTETRDRHELEQQLGLLGGDLSVGHDADKLTIGGNVLADRLDDFLELLSDVLGAASYPKVEVDRERSRLAEQLQMADASAGTIAAKAVARRLYGTHRYSLLLPEPEDLEGIGAASVRSLHRKWVLPQGSVLVLVGSLAPRKALDLAERALTPWQGAGPSGPAVKDPFGGTSGDAALVHVVDRPGSVQSAIRVGLPGIGRTDEQYAAARVATMLFGGYFSSRLVANLREDKGYTYTPRSAIALHSEGSAITVSADVSTAVTGAALNEIRYELGRIATTLPLDDELENARQYLIGGGLLSLSTQSGLATTAASMEFDGVGFEFLWEHQRALAKVTAADVLDVSRRLLSPARGRYVVVGDTDEVTPQLRLLGQTETD